MNSLKGKTAIITGASGGIGKALAESLNKEGMNLFLTDVNNLPYELPCSFFKCDITRDNFAEKITDECLKAFGRIDVLINNAGIASLKELEHVTKEDLFRHFEINAYAPLALSMACIPYLEMHGEGDIITISSVAGLYPYTGQGAYGASKSAQKSLMQTLSKELYDKKSTVRVHTLYPTGVDTEMIRITRPDLNMNDFSKPEEIAEIILFILMHRNNSCLDEIKIRRCAKRPFEP